MTLTGADEVFSLQGDGSEFPAGKEGGCFIE